MSDNTTRAGESEQPSLPTVGEQAKRVGAWETPEGFVSFGSWQAVAAFYIHAQADMARDMQRRIDALEADIATYRKTLAYMLVDADLNSIARKALEPK